jgi:hypothetical protein
VLTIPSRHAENTASSLSKHPHYTIVSIESACGPQVRMSTGRLARFMLEITSEWLFAARPRHQLSQSREPPHTELPPTTMMAGVRFASARLCIWPTITDDCTRFHNSSASRPPVANGHNTTPPHTDKPRSIHYICRDARLPIHARRNRIMDAKPRRLPTILPTGARPYFPARRLLVEMKLRHWSHSPLP